MKARLVFRRDGIQGFYRIARMLWTRGTVGDGRGYSAKLSLAVDWRLLDWGRDASTDWRITLLGVRLHYCRSYGGIMV